MVNIVEIPVRRNRRGRARNNATKVTVVQTPRRARRVRRGRRTRVATGSNFPRTPLRRELENAPVAVGFNSPTKPMGLFKPSVLGTADLVSNVQFGTNNFTVIYNTKVSPQDMPLDSRAQTMARLYNKYRCNFLRFRIQSAIPTSAGGQYAAFFDPNPSTNWISGGVSAVSALTSMPVQDVKAAWQCLELVVPTQELGRDIELFTQDATLENLVTRIGQLVILNLATPNVTPPGSAVVTVWIDAEWEFYEPNARHQSLLSPVLYSVGSWTAHAAGDAFGAVIDKPAVISGTLVGRTAYRLFPALPGSMFVDAVDCEFVATLPNLTTYGFASEEAALEFTITGAAASAKPGTGTAVAVPTAIAFSPLIPLGREVIYPYKAVPD